MKEEIDLKKVMQDDSVSHKNEKKKNHTYMKSEKMNAQNGKEMQKSANAQNNNQNSKNGEKNGKNAQNAHMSTQKSNTREQIFLFFSSTTQANISAALLPDFNITGFLNSCAKIPYWYSFRAYFK